MYQRNKGIGFIVLAIGCLKFVHVKLNF